MTQPSQVVPMHVLGQTSGSTLLSVAVTPSIFKSAFCTMIAPPDGSGEVRRGRVWVGLGTSVSIMFSSRALFQNLIPLDLAELSWISVSLISTSEPSPMAMAPPEPSAMLSAISPPVTRITDADATRAPPAPIFA